MLKTSTEFYTILTKYQTPPFRPVLPKDTETAFYEFMDSTGSGYGRSIQIPQNKGANPECLM